MNTESMPGVMAFILFVFFGTKLIIWYVKSRDGGV